MAARDLLDYIDEHDILLSCTPNRKPSRISLNRSRHSSSRKSGNLRKLYTPKNTADDDNEENEPLTRRRKLSSISNNATFGNGSHIDSSFDVVNVTPGVETVKSHTFQSILSNRTALSCTQKQNLLSKTLFSPTNRNTFVYACSSKENIHQKVIADKPAPVITVSGITSLGKSSIASYNKSKTPECSSSDSYSTAREKSSSDKSEGSVHNGQAEVQTANRINSHNFQFLKSSEKSKLFETPTNGQTSKNIGKNSSSASSSNKSEGSVHNDQAEVQTANGINSHNFQFLKSSEKSKLFETPINGQTSKNIGKNSSSASSSEKSEGSLLSNQPHLQTPNGTNTHSLHNLKSTEKSLFFITPNKRLAVKCVGKNVEPGTPSNSDFPNNSPEAASRLPETPTRSSNIPNEQFVTKRHRRTFITPFRKDVTTSGSSTASGLTIASKSTPTLATPPNSKEILKTPSSSVSRRHEASPFATPSNSGTVPETPTSDNCNGQFKLQKPDAIFVTPSNSRKVLKTPSSNRPIPVGEVASGTTSETVDDSADDDNLPSTQPISSLLMTGVIAYVEVRSRGDNHSWGINRSFGVKEYLKSLGATVRDNFTNDVTHVVFNEGLMSTYKKAMKLKAHLVSVLWIEECVKAQQIVSERLYPACDIQKYESPDLLNKLRKVRSLQPHFEGEPKARRRLKKVVPEKEYDPEKDLPILPFYYKKKVKIPGFLEDASNKNEYIKTLLSVADIGPEHEERVNRPSTPTANDDEEIDSPPELAVQLLRNMLNSKSNLNGSPLNGESSTPLSTVTDNSAVSMDVTPTRRKSVRFTSKKNGPSVDSSKDNAANNGQHAEQLAVAESSHKSRDETERGLFKTTKNKVETAVKRTYGRLQDIAAKISKDIQLQNSQSSTAKVQSTSKIQGNRTVEKQNDASKGDMSSSSKGLSSRKRKLMNLNRTGTSEELEMPVVEEEVEPISSQCPYTPEERPRKKRKSEHKADGAVPSTSNETSARKILHARKKCDFSSGKKRELVSNGRFSTRNSLDAFVTTPRRKVLAEGEDNAQNAVERKLPSLVCTGLQKDEVGVIAAIVKKLGGFTMEGKVSANTTHVVTNGPKRTLNMLRGIGRGCWILLQDWVLRSLEAEEWLEEDEFELTDFSPAVQRCRVQKQAFGRVYKQDLFSNCGAICVSNTTVPPKRDLEDLLRLFGGRVVNARRAAKLMVGYPSSPRYDGLIYVSEKWVLDSAQYCSLKNTNDYEI